MLESRMHAEGAEETGVDQDQSLFVELLDVYLGELDEEARDLLDGGAHICLALLGGRSRGIPDPRVGRHLCPPPRSPRPALADAGQSPRARLAGARFVQGA